MRNLPLVLANLGVIFIDALAVFDAMPPAEQLTRLANVRETSNALMAVYSDNDDALNRLLALELFLQTLDRNSKSRMLQPQMRYIN